jgi:hypothetical protein
MTGSGFRGRGSRLVTLQQRHFELIAEMVATLATLAWDDRAKVARHFAIRLRGTNENFDEPRFLEACGVERY